MAETENNVVDIMHNVRTETIRVLDGPLKLLRATILILRSLFYVISILCFCSLVSWLYTLAKMLYNDPGVVFSFIWSISKWLVIFLYKTARSYVFKEPQIPVHVRYWNCVCTYFEYSRLWLVENWIFTCLLVVGFAIILLLAMSTRRLCIRIGQSVRRVKRYEIVREAMVNGSDFLPRSTTPAYQVSVSTPGAFSDTHVGWGIRVREYLVTYLHVLEGLRAIVLRSSSGKKISFDLSAFKMRQSRLNSDLTYVRLNNDVWTNLGVTTALCPSNIFAVDHNASITGEWGFGSCGVLTKFEDQLGCVNYFGSTKPGYSGAAYFVSSSPKLCYGLHNGVANGTNFGVSMSTIEREVRRCEIFDDPVKHKNYRDYLLAKRAANNGVKLIPESSRKIGQYGRTGCKIIGRKANGHWNYDDFDYNSYYDEVGYMDSRTRKGKWDEVDLERHIDESWQRDYLDDDREEDFSTPLTQSWADYVNDLERATAAYRAMADQRLDAAPTFTESANGLGQVGRPVTESTTTTSVTIRGVPEAAPPIPQFGIGQVLCTPHVNGAGDKQIPIQLVSPPTQTPLHESYMILESRIRQLERQVELLQATLKRMDIKQCHLCVYSNPHTIAKHLREAHGDLPKSSLKTCAHCNHAFDSEAYLKHKCYECSHCGKKCSEDGLKDHILVCTRKPSGAKKAEKPTTSQQSYAKVVKESANPSDFAEVVATSDVPFLGKRASSKKRTSKTSKRRSPTKGPEPNSSSLEVVLSKILESQLTSQRNSELLLQALVGQKAAEKLN